MKAQRVGRGRGRRTTAPDIRHVYLVVAGVVFSLIVVEVLLRVTDFGAVQPQMDFDQNTRMVLHTGQMVPDPKLLWRESDVPRTKAEEQLNVIRVGDVVPPKSRKFRILCLGDSCTRLSVRGMPYSVLLEQQLGPEEVEVFNASIPGYSSYQCLAWLRSQLLEYEPDLVVVYLGWNDHWRTTGWTDRELAARLSPWRPRILNLLQRRHKPAPFRVPPPEFGENMRAMAGIVAGHGGQTLFLTPPALFTDQARAHHVEAGYILPGDDLAAIHTQYQEEIRRLSPESGARVFDTAQLFDRLQDPELLFSDGIHPTDLGHEVLAVTLADEIDTHRLRASGADSATHTDPVALGQAVIAQSLAASNRWDEALRHSRQAAQAAPQDQDIVLGHAWLLAICPADSLRDPGAALAQLDAYRGKTSPGYRFHDVRGAALAARGRYSEAIVEAREALRQLGSSGEEAGLASSIHARMALYQAHRPYFGPNAAKHP